MVAGFGCRGRAWDQVLDTIYRASADRAQGHWNKSHIGGKDEVVDESKDAMRFCPQGGVYLSN